MGPYRALEGPVGPYGALYRALHRALHEALHRALFLDPI